MTDAPEPARDSHDRADDDSLDDSLDDDSLDDDSLDDEVLATGQTTSALGVSAGGGEATLDAYDLDHDGKVSLVEAARAQLGVVDARLEEAAEQGGIAGRLADAAHHVVDRLDNDDEHDAGDA